METKNITQPPRYQVELMVLSLGLAQVSREWDGLFLDYLSEDQTRAVRIAIHVSTAQKMLGELQKTVALLAANVGQQSGTTTSSH